MNIIKKYEGFKSNIKNKIRDRKDKVMDQWDEIWREMRGESVEVDPGCTVFYLDDFSVYFKMLITERLREGGKIDFAENSGHSARRQLARAQYIWTDKAVSRDFVKREGQVLIFVYAKDFEGELKGCEDRKMFLKYDLFATLAMADYICVYNEEVWQKLNWAYGLENIYHGRVIVTEDNEAVYRCIYKGDEDVVRPLQKNGRPNVLIYPGNLAQQGITTAFKGMMGALDRSRHNDYIVLPRDVVLEHPECLEGLPEDAVLFPMREKMPKGLFAAVALRRYLNKGERTPWIRKKIYTRYSREWQRSFGTASFDHAVQYCGYETYATLLFQAAPCENTIWVHSDMEQEVRLRSNQNLFLLQDAYAAYDHVVVVSEDIRKQAARIGRREDNIQVIGNFHDYRRVRRRAEEEVRFDPGTKSNVTLEELQKILDSGADKFISIGRYSVEKGHRRLMEAFAQYWKVHQNAYLIIIGGGGDLYEDTVEYANTLNVPGHIFLLREVSNPMPILKRCSLFLLPSHYEGLGLAMLEADILGVPVMACDVSGPRGFLKAHGGTLLRDSREGILDGMRMYAHGKAHTMNVDYEQLNAECIEKCEVLFGAGKTK